jgi:serine protease Do
MLNKISRLVFLAWLFGCQSALAQLPDFTELVKKCGGAVVNVSTTQKAADSDQQQLPDDLQMPEGTPFDDLFRHFFQGPGAPGFVPRETKSLGSGFILSSDGYILTNHHVVKDADEIVVKLQDRRELEAKLVGSDPRTDIALLKVKANGFPLVRIGSADRLQVGEWVLAIGSPFGFESSVTAGIVSAKGRSLPGDNYVPFIQTDVAINPGNSGGPLFNMEGEVVGINSQIYSRTGGFMGLSFAIPIDVALNVVEQIKATGKVSRGWLGVQIQDVTRELAESFNMDRPHGALVAKVISGSPAEKAGLQIGDVIVEFNGQNIETSSELPPLVGMTAIGSNAVLKLIRQGEREEADIKIGLLPDEEEVALAGSEEPGAKNVERLGIAVSELTSEQREQFQVMKGGVLVQQVSKGAAADAGIERGDVILRIGNNVVRDGADFAKIIADIPAGKSIAVLIQRRGSPVFLAIKLDK